LIDDVTCPVVISSTPKLAIERESADGFLQAGRLAAANVDNAEDEVAAPTTATDCSDVTAAAEVAAAAQMASFFVVFFVRPTFLCHWMNASGASVMVRECPRLVD
jgi:hypothetical protein